MFAALSLFPVEGAFRTASGSVAEGWLAAWVRLLWPAVVVAVAAISTWTWLRTGSIAGRGEPDRRGVSGLVHALRPVSWLPLCAVLRFCPAWIGTGAAAIALPLGTALVLAWSLERATSFAFAARDTTPSMSSRWRKGAAFAFLLSFAALGSVYLWQGRDRFVGGGDAVHYMTQLDNLLERGNLDLTERMERILGQRHDRRPAIAEKDMIGWSHARRNARGRIYSVHAFGYPVLALPFARIFGRDAGPVVLGLLLGAIGVSGVWACARLCGALPIAATVASATLCLSWFWAFTAASRLPEMLGCSLVIWAFWGAVAAVDAGRRRDSEEASRRRFAMSCAVSCVCCAYLPVSHMRFFPVAAVLAIAWIAAALAAREVHPLRRVAAVAVFCAVVAASWLALWRAHGRMFEGVSSFTLESIFFSSPLAMLGMFADRLGAAAIFPLLWLLCLAPVWIFVAPRGDGAPPRAAAALALAVEVVTLVACCAQPGAIGGACVSGRYFLQALAPLVIVGAVWLSRVGPVGRVWYYFLALLPVLYLFAVSPFCSGWGLVYSPFGLYDLDSLRQFPMPLGEVLSQIPSGGALQSVASFAVPLAAVAVSALLSVRRPSRLRVVAAAAVLALGAGGGICADSFLRPVLDNPAWAFSHGRGWRHFRLISGTAASDFFSAFRHDGVEPDAPSLVVYHGEKPADIGGRRPVDVSRVAPNDWFGRDLRWIELRPFPLRDNRRGALAVRVKGRVERGSARLASSIGPEAFPAEGLRLAEGPFDAVMLVPVRRGVRSATVFAAIDGADGALFVDFVEVAPYACGLESAVGPFPADAIVSDCLRGK